MWWIFVILWGKKECSFILCLFEASMSTLLFSWSELWLNFSWLQQLLTVFFSFRFTNDGLKRLCEIFDLEKKGKRVCLRIMYCCVTKAKAADCFHFKLIHIECKIICLIFFICIKLQLFTLSSFAHGLTLKLWRILNLLRNGLLHQKPLH